MGQGHVIDIFDKNGWDWTCHGMGGWNGWNPTFDAEAPMEGGWDGGQATDRLEMLKAAWNKNTSPN